MEEQNSGRNTSRFSNEPVPQFCRFGFRDSQVSNHGTFKPALQRATEGDSRTRQDVAREHSKARG